MTTLNRALCASALCAVLLVQTGCVIRRERLQDAPTVIAKNTSGTVSLDGATKGEVVVMMGAGALRMGSGARDGHLLDGDFSFYPDGMAPVFEPATLGSRKQVVIRNNGEDDLRGLGIGIGRGTVRNEWDLKLAKSLPTVVTVSLGAGDGDIDLSEIDVERLSLTMGAGDTTVDLAGDRTHDVDGSIQAGAGSITIKLPSNVGVRVKGVQDGIGEWKAPGFSRQGNFFVNDAYATSAVKIELNVQRGVGEVNLELVD